MRLLQLFISLWIGALSGPVISGQQAGVEKKENKGSAQTDESQLIFSQARIAAQMRELEERMFRLAEALKSLEPENASRLMLGLKAARDELIQLQMAQTKELLEVKNLSEASNAQKEILAKLKRLQELLLATDLDFQLKLEKLRQIRAIIAQLQKAIAEEEREKSITDQLAEKSEQRKQLETRIDAIRELIERETQHIADASQAADKIVAEGGSDKQKKQMNSQSKRQGETRQRTEQLTPVSDNTTTAAQSMKVAEQSLRGGKPKAALNPQNQALTALQDELKMAAQQLSEIKSSERVFAQLQGAQLTNQQLTEDITESTRQLGENGSEAVSELNRASSSMASAGQQLGKQQAVPASNQQQRATDALKYAKEQLSDEAERLLNEIRDAVKRFVMAALGEMLDKQIRVREATELLGPRVAKGSRPAVTAVVGLGKSEQTIVDLAQEVISLVEETEFGIALPTAMRVVMQSMVGVRDSLKGGDASEPVVQVEKEIEKDLRLLEAAMKDMPASPPSAPGKKGSPQEQERELNRLIAELKLIRMLQVRVNGGTLSVDGKRNSESFPKALQVAVEKLAEQQEDILIATEELIETRIKN